MILEEKKKLQEAEKQAQTLQHRVDMMATDHRNLAHLKPLAFDFQAPAHLSFPKSIEDFKMLR